MLKFSLVGAASALLLAVPVAQVAAQESQSEEAEEADPYAPDTIRCRTRRVIGSNARRIRTCMTNAEWRAMADIGNADAVEILERGLMSGCRAPGTSIDVGTGRVDNAGC